MKRLSILALTFILTATMLTACRSNKGNNTTATTQMTTTAPLTRPTTAPTTATTMPPQTTQGPTSPQNTTIGPGGTVGTENNDQYTDETIIPEDSGMPGNGSDTTGEAESRTRGMVRNGARSFRRF